MRTFSDTRRKCTYTLARMFSGRFLSEPAVETALYPPQQGQKLRCDIGSAYHAWVQTALRCHDIIISGRNGRLVEPETFPHESFDPVAPDSRSNLPGYGEAQPPLRGRFFPYQREQDEITGKVTLPVFVAAYKVGPPRQPVRMRKTQTANLLRPLARRRRRISRPAGVLMRARNPCTRLRLIWLGW